jgi:hypothetical protein
MSLSPIVVDFADHFSPRGRLDMTADQRSQHSAVGDGVEKAAFLAALKIMICPGDLWQEYNTYMAPRFRAMEDDTRMHHYRAAGLLIGLWILKYKSAPATVSPFLLAFAALKRPITLPLGFIAAIDQDLAKRLAPWYALAPTDPINTAWLRWFTSFYTADVIQIFLISILQPLTQAFSHTTIC